MTSAFDGGCSDVRRPHRRRSHALTTQGLEVVSRFDPVQSFIEVGAAVVLIFFLIRRSPRQRYRSAAIFDGYDGGPVLLVYLRAMFAVSLLRHDFLANGVRKRAY
jgi:hypothetical protein